MKPIERPAGPVSFLYNRLGQRKYLTVPERRVFLHAARRMPLRIRLFCEVLAYAGARISEVLALTPNSFDEAAGFVIIESLKKRRRGVFRAVPIPRALIAEILSLCLVSGLLSPDDPKNQRIWDCCRVTAWSWVKQVMTFAKITGPKASPKVSVRSIRWTPVVANHVRTKSAYSVC